MEVVPLPIIVPIGEIEGEDDALTSSCSSGRGPVDAGKGSLPPGGSGTSSTSGVSAVVVIPLHDDKFLFRGTPEDLALTLLDAYHLHPRELGAEAPKCQIFEGRTGMGDEFGSDPPQGGIAPEGGLVGVKDGIVGLVARSTDETQKDTAIGVAAFVVGVTAGATIIFREGSHSHGEFGEGRCGRNQVVVVVFGFPPCFVFVIDVSACHKHRSTYLQTILYGRFDCTRVDPGTNVNVGGASIRQSFLQNRQVSIQWIAFVLVLDAISIDFAVVIVTVVIPR